MNDQVCDRHSSARAQARVILPSLGTLYFCLHCAHQFGRTYQGDYHIDYDVVTV